jgi:transcriptional regulator with XRE-family HTH domain
VVKNVKRSAFAQNIITRRKALGLNQADLAHKAGIHRNFLARIETAKSAGSEATKEAIAGALGCSVEDLYRTVKPIRPDHVTLADLARGEARILELLETRLPPAPAIPQELVEAWTGALPAAQVFALWILTGLEKYKFELETRWPGVYRVLQDFFGARDSILKAVDEKP